MSDIAIVVDEVVTRTPAPVSVRVPVAFGSSAAMWRELSGYAGIGAARTGIDSLIAGVPQVDGVTGYFADAGTLRMVETPDANATDADTTDAEAIDAEATRKAVRTADSAHNSTSRGRPRGRPV